MKDVKFEYRILKSSFDEILMRAKAFCNGQEIEVKGTWAFAPELSWYDETNLRWVCSNEWSFIY